MHNKVGDVLVPRSDPLGPQGVGIRATEVGKIRHKNTNRLGRHTPRE
jgi:hypothetical protein